MSEPTLSLSNTTRPMLESVVLRERLFTQIEAGLDCQITWIQGPLSARSSFIAVHSSPMTSSYCVTARNGMRCIRD